MEFECKSDVDNDESRFSDKTLTALQEFYREQEESDIISFYNGISQTLTSTNDIEENWQLSQFWYDDYTASTLSKIVSKVLGSSCKVALLSCPTMYTYLKKELDVNSEVALYEFDKRFSMYGADYIFYDYNTANLMLPEDKENYYDLVLADPPFVSEECLTKMAVIIKYLAKDRIILCTGTNMEPLAEKLLGLKSSSFKPKHTRNLENDSLDLLDDIPFNVRQDIWFIQDEAPPHFRAESFKSMFPIIQ